MFAIAFYVLLGMFIGWFIMPQPEWAATFMTWLVSKVPVLGKYVKK